MYYEYWFCIFVFLKTKYTMLSIINNLEDKVIFESENEQEFIDFVNKIRIENEDYNLSILGLMDAIEYVENYCSNLTLSKD